MTRDCYHIYSQNMNVIGNKIKIIIEILIRNDLIINFCRVSYIG